MICFALLIISILCDDQIKTITLHEIITDFIQEYDYKVYRLQIQNQDYLINKSLIIALIPQIGNPEMVVNCDNQPKLLEYYEWQAQSWYMQQLSITYNERQALNCSDKEFYIGVSSEVVSGYKLIAYVMNGLQILEYNIPMSGELVPNEIIQFKLLPQEENEQITIQITANQAQAYLKQCNSNECSISSEDFTNNDTDVGIHLKQQSIQFTHTDCPQCYYLIGLQADKKIPYRILAKYNESITDLREGQTEQMELEEGFYSYYQLSVPNDKNIKSIKFQLTTYNGTCLMFGSQINKYPNQTDYQQTNEHQIQIASESQYYLSVFAQSFCSFGIYTQVERFQTINQTHFIQLQSGLPQSYLQNETFSYFQIQLNEIQNLTINLQSTNGTFFMYVKSNLNEQEVPDSNSFTWSDDRQIQIDFNDEDFSTDYYIGVQKLSQGQGQFTIQYVLNGDIEQYKIGQQIIGIVDQNNWKYYKIAYEARDLTITKDIYSSNDINDLSVYISLNGYNKHPNRSNYDYNLKGKNLTIPEQYLICKQKLNKMNEKQICYLYLALISNSGTIFYTISTKQNNTNIQLYEGYPQTLTFDQETIFYYIMKQKEISIQWYSQGGSQAIINAWYGEKNSSQRYQQFTPKFYGQYQDIIIPQTNQYDILYISVKPIQFHYQDDTYTIGVYEEVKLLTQSDPFIDYGLISQIKYYRIIITEDINSLLINVNVLSGSTGVNVYIQQGKDSRPDQDYQSEYKISQYGSSFIIQRYNNSDKIMNDDYILGIHCFDDCEYQVSYNQDNAKYYHAFSAYPFDVMFFENIPYYYVYYAEMNKTQKVVLSVLKGKLRIKLRVSNSQDILDQTGLLINQVVSTQASFKLNNCTNTISCIYIAEIIAEDGDGQGVLEFVKFEDYITLYDQFQWTEILNENEIANYNYFSYQPIQINIQLISGDIKFYLKEGLIINNTNEVNISERIQEDTQIEFNNSTGYIAIKIESLVKSSVYKISINKQLINTYTINIGQMQVRSLKNMQTLAFQYQSITQNSTNLDKFITLQIQIEQGSIDNLQFDITHTSIKPINYYNKYPRAIVYHLYDQFGIYQINITTKIQQITTFKIVLSNGEMSTLISGVSQYQIVKVGLVQYYEIFVYQKSKVLLEAFTCQGTILIQGTAYKTNLAKQVFEIQPQNSSSEHVQSILSFEPGTYYLMVKLINSQDENQLSSYYIEQQTFYTNEIIPFTAFEFKKKSAEWNKLDDKLIIHIPNLNQIQPQLNITKIYFIVRIQQAIGDQSLACMFESNYVNNKTNIYGKHTLIIEQQENSEITVAMFTAHDHQSKYLSIVGKVQLDIDGQIEELTYPMPIIEMNYVIQTQNQQIQGWLLLGLFIIIIILTGLFIYINVKQQVGHQEHNLNIEMNYQTFNNT